MEKSIIFINHKIENTMLTQQTMVLDRNPLKLTFSLANSGTPLKDIEDIRKAYISCANSFEESAVDVTSSIRHDLEKDQVVILTSHSAFLFKLGMLIATNSIIEELEKAEV